jgi:hypothetical protein
MISKCLSGIKAGPVFLLKYKFFGFKLFFKVFLDRFNVMISKINLKI